jgi:hypothetical protein
MDTACNDHIEVENWRAGKASGISCLRHSLASLLDPAGAGSIRLFSSGPVASQAATRRHFRSGSRWGYSADGACQATGHCHSPEAAPEAVAQGGDRGDACIPSFRRAAPTGRG